MAGKFVIKLKIIKFFKTPRSRLIIYLIKIFLLNQNKKSDFKKVIDKPNRILGNKKNDTRKI
jgi:hypothetical protein